MPPHAASRPDRILLGIASMVASVSLFSIVNVIVKALAARYPIAQIMFFRCAIALLPAAILVLRHPRGVGVLRTRRPGAHAVRSVFGMVAMATSFAAFRYLPAADVVAINFAAPLFVTALSVPLLGESVGWRRWTALVIGFAGVLVMLQPEAMFATEAAKLGGLLALASALAYALAVIAIRQIARDEPSVTVVVVYMLCVAAVSGAITPFVWVPPTRDDFVLLVALGLIGGGAQIFLTRAFEHAPPAAVMPFEYLSLVVTAFLAWLAWSELPGGTTILGAAIVIASGLFIFHREAALARVRPPSAR